MVDSSREALAKARDWITIEEHGPDGWIAMSATVNYTNVLAAKKPRI